jgi:6-phosphogluconolactonase
MGADGHTASFFPDADDLAELLDPSSQRIVLPVHAQSAGEPRLTLSMARIVAAGFIALHIEGEDKRTAFDGAMGPGAEKPIRRVLEAAPMPVEVFWAP